MPSGAPEKYYQKNLWNFRLDWPRLNNGTERDPGYRIASTTSFNLANDSPDE